MPILIGQKPMQLVLLFTIQEIGKKDELGSVIQDLNMAIQLQPFPKVYNLRAWTWLRLEEWEKAKSDFAAMQSVNYDFIPIFYTNYESVEDFEQQYDVQLPDDLKTMLTRSA